MRTIVLLVAASALVGCGASAPIPIDKLTRAQESVRHAEETPEVVAAPQAFAHLTLAKNQLQYAKKLMADGHNEDAHWTLMRAESDAQAALSLAHAEAARVDAQQTIDAVRQAMTLMQQEGSGS